MSYPIEYKLVNVVASWALSLLDKSDNVFRYEEMPVVSTRAMSKSRA